MLEIFDELFVMRFHTMLYLSYGIYLPLFRIYHRRSQAYDSPVLLILSLVQGLRGHQ